MWLWTEKFSKNSIFLNCSPWIRSDIWLAAVWITLLPRICRVPVLPSRMTTGVTPYTIPSLGKWPPKLKPIIWPAEYAGTSLMPRSGISSTWMQSNPKFLYYSPSLTLLSSPQLTFFIHINSSGALRISVSSFFRSFTYYLYPPSFIHYCSNTISPRLHLRLWAKVRLALRIAHSLTAHIRRSSIGQFEYRSRRELTTTADWLLFIPILF